MNKPSKEELEDLILVKKKAYTEIAKLYDVSDVTIKKWAISFEIPVPSRKQKITGVMSICPNCNKEFQSKKDSRGGFTECCCRSCADELKVKRNYEKYKLDNSTADGQRNMQSFKKHFLEEQGGTCAICGMKDTWNEQQIIFILDHIDGNADNNNRENLRLICPNCDSQLDTYKSKNKNSARAKYRKY